MPNFASVACPLTDLTKKGVPNKINWQDHHEKAFSSLKSLLLYAPILRLPDFQRDFYLRTDASEYGIGAVLLQEHERKFPIAYASRKLNERERGYSVIEKECLAIVWAVKKFQAYLYGRTFVLETDRSLYHCQVGWQPVWSTSVTFKVRNCICGYYLNNLILYALATSFIYICKSRHFWE